MFKDFRKAFDRVRHRKLIDTLKTSILTKNIAIVKAIYWNQKAIVKVNEIETNISIARLIRQGCILIGQTVPDAWIATKWNFTLILIKPKFMIILKRPTNNKQLTMSGQQIERITWEPMSTSNWMRVRREIARTVIMWQKSKYWYQLEVCWMYC